MEESSLKTIDRPFEGILGSTVELRILERLIASPEVEFNITELGAMTGVHRDSASKVIEKFTRWNILKFTSRKGNMDLFKLNTEEPLVISINAFNDSIVMQMFPEVEGVLEEMAFDPLVDPTKIREKNGPFVSTTVESEPIIPPLCSDRSSRGATPTRAW